MSRRCIIVLLFVVGVATLSPAAILPPRLGDFNQTGSQQFTPTEATVYQEYGLDAAEKAQYAAGERKLEITALRAKDATGAFGMFQWLRPRDSKPVDQGERGAEKGEMMLFQYGNYVLILRGSKPEEDHLNALLSILPRFERTPPPPLIKQLPAEGRIPNSERFVLGPVVLAKLAPGIPPSVAAFHVGAEGETAEYAANGGRLTMVLFSYPTPQLARAQFEEFQKLPNIITKRSNTLIAAVLNPFSRDEAEKLLARVRYEATLTWSEKPNRRNDNIGDFLLNVVLLCLILAGLMLAAGIGFGGGRILLTRWRPGSRFAEKPEADIIRLNLTNR